MHSQAPTPRNALWRPLIPKRFKRSLHTHLTPTRPYLDNIHRISTSPYLDRNIPNPNTPTNLVYMIVRDNAIPSSSSAYLKLDTLESMVEIRKHSSVIQALDQAHIFDGVGGGFGDGVGWVVCAAFAVACCAVFIADDYERPDGAFLAA